MNRRHFTGRFVALGAALIASLFGKRAEANNSLPKDSLRVPITAGERYDKEYIKTVLAKVKEVMETEPPEGMEVAVVWSWAGEEWRIAVEYVRAKSRLR